MKIKKLLLIPALVSVMLTVFYSCEKEDKMEDNSTTGKVEDTSKMIDGMVRIKLGRATTQSLKVSLKSGLVETSNSNMDTLFSSIGVTSFKRTFPYAGKYEERTKSCGLDLWYDVKFDSTKVKLEDVLGDFRQLSEVSTTEGVLRVKPKKVQFIPVEEVLKVASNLKSSNVDYPFNDTYLDYQWHYNNEGSIDNEVEGSDINLFDAWTIQTGSENVIVAVVDGGIDVDHVDLADNVWVNSGESSNSSDSDDNGYVDDVHGYNFVDNTGEIVAHDHGTHVAGTIGAVNNNGVGVCGIAGGDGTKLGVRLMSCQVFSTNADGDDVSSDNFAAAIKYGADNGAVISQNSWGYDGATSIPSYMKEAIDYFIEYAGIDENGNQVGPMKGGIVVFAAGNDAEDVGYPASYDPVIAVAAVAPDFKIAYYSNYGSWIDITAPGGSYEDTGYDVENMVLSTGPDDKYFWSIGTSMSCPHVSGVAALIVSEFGQDGFTADDLKERLVQGAYSLDEDNPSYSGYLGSGLINAYAGLLDYNSSAPDVVNDLSGSVDQNAITLDWKVTADQDNIKAYSYSVFYSQTEFGEDDISSGNANIEEVDAYVWHASIGEGMEHILSSLDFSTDYYVAIKAVNVFGTASDLSNVIQLTTSDNQPPVITLDGDAEFSIKAHETKSLYCTIEDPESHSVSWTFEDNSGNASARGTNKTVLVTFSGLNAPLGGIYQSSLIASDEFGATSTLVFNYEIEANHAPVVTQDIEDTYWGDPNESMSFDLSEYINDEDGESLTYTFEYDESLVAIDINGDDMTITPQSMGLSEITVVATDALEESCSITFNLMVRDDSNEFDVYPNPVVDNVYIRGGDNVDGNLDVDVYNTNGILVGTYQSSIETFQPAKFDLSDLKTGTYTLKITLNSTVFEYNIVKL